MAKKKPQDKKNELVPSEVVQNIAIRLCTDGRLIFVWPTIFLIFGIVWLVPPAERSQFILEAIRTNFVWLSALIGGLIVIALTGWSVYKHNQQRDSEMERISDSRTEAQKIGLSPNETSSSKPKKE